MFSLSCSELRHLTTPSPSTHSPGALRIAHWTRTQPSLCPPPPSSFGQCPLGPACPHSGPRPGSPWLSVGVESPALLRCREGSGQGQFGEPRRPHTPSQHEPFRVLSLICPHSPSLPPASALPLFLTILRPFFLPSSLLSCSISLLTCFLSPFPSHPRLSLSYSHAPPTAQPPLPAPESLCDPLALSLQGTLLRKHGKGIEKVKQGLALRGRSSGSVCVRMWVGQGRTQDLGSPGCL